MSLECVANFPLSPYLLEFIKVFVIKKFVKFLLKKEEVTYNKKSSFWSIGVWVGPGTFDFSVEIEI